MICICKTCYVEFIEIIRKYQGQKPLNVEKIVASISVRLQLKNMLISRANSNDPTGLKFFEHVFIIVSDKSHKNTSFKCNDKKSTNSY